MDVRVIKRDGRIEPFYISCISNALQAAGWEVLGDRTVDEGFNTFAFNTSCDIYNWAKDSGLDKVSVEEIQDKVEEALLNSKYKTVAQAYIRYRERRTNARKNTIDDVVNEITDGNNDYWTNENSNKNATLATTQRDYVAGAVSTDQSKRVLLPTDVVKAHEQGIIHFHDMDYFLQRIPNCCLINLEDMLQNGTVISNVKIDKPHKFSTACNIATQIIAQVASSQYGGQSISLAHLSPFIESSRVTFKKRYSDFSDKQIEELVQNDIESGIQTLQYQITTLMTTNGQAPFITVYMNLNEAPEGKTRDDLAKAIEEVLKQRIRGVKNEQGVWVTPAFPKLIYALDENNIHEDSPYWYLTRLAAECTAKRMVPDYISNKVERELKGDEYTCMGCRSFLTPDRTTKNYANALNYNPGHKYYGRFNQGVVTINLVDVACSSHKDMDKFWKIFDERLELCHKALQCRHKRLMGTKSDIAPIHWQHGALARLKKGETIDELLLHGYSTISLGYAGLYECTMYMTGESHTDKRGHDFAMKVMQHMNDKCNDWMNKEDIAYSLYGTPLESSTYRFAKCLQKRFGKIKGVTDHDYITNSYHVNVREKIDAFSKLKLESEFQKLSPGGLEKYIA